MEKNMILSFVDKMKQNLIFNIEYFEMSDLQENSEESIPKKLNVTYQRFVDTGLSARELTELKLEVLNYLSEKFENSKIAYEELVVPSIEFLVKFHNDFINKEIDGQEYLWHKDVNLLYNNSDESYGVKLDTVFSNDDLIIVSETIKKLKEIIDSILSFHNRLLASIDRKHAVEKIKLKISVAEIALLFRLLYDAEIINHDNSKANIFRMISASLSTEYTNNISESSLRNNWSTFDQTSLDSMKSILVDMRNTLNQL